MHINYWAVLVCGIVSMILGSIWYGPLFGKTWMKLCGMDPNDKEKMKAESKGMAKLYVTQFIMSLLQAFGLAVYVVALPNPSVGIALFIWFTFVMTTLVGTVLWGNDKGKAAWTRFGVQAGYQVILFVLFGLILGMWR